MNNRLNSLKELNSQLNFNRYTLSAIDEATKEAVKKAGELINEINTSEENILELNLAYIQASLKVGTHAAIFKRESKTARSYLWHPQFIQQLKALNETICNSENMPNDQLDLLSAETTNMILYIEALDGSVKDIDVLLDKYFALRTTYLNLQNEEIDTNALTLDQTLNYFRDCLLGKEVANRYRAMMQHRLSMDRKNPDTKQRLDFSFKAQSNLALSISSLIENRTFHINVAQNLSIFHRSNLAKDYPLCLIDVAEMYHLLGVACKEESLLPTESTDSLVRAEEALRTAWEYWDKAAAVTNSINPIVYITMQSLADILRRQGRLAEAGTLYKDVIQKQIVFYGTEDNTDVAKSLHSYGEFFESKKDYALALEKLTQSLAIKRKINSPMTSFTVEAIQRVRDKIALVDTSYLRLMQKPEPQTPNSTPENISAENKTNVERFKL